MAGIAYGQWMLNRLSKEQAGPTPEPEAEVYDDEDGLVALRAAARVPPAHSYPDVASLDVSSPVDFLPRLTSRSLAPFPALRSLWVAHQRLCAVAGLEACPLLEVRLAFSPFALLVDRRPLSPSPCGWSTAACCRSTAWRRRFVCASWC